jgi:Zn-finger nucleic acid-binding protein
MERMLCESCAAASYSAAARQIVERGDRCPRCGGVLAIDSGDSGERVPAGAASEEAPQRRFTERTGQ